MEDKTLKKGDKMSDNVAKQKIKTATEIETMRNEKYEWLTGGHLHCKKCGAIITCAGRINWKLITGVKACGMCDNCGLLLIQSEHRKIKWVKI